MNSPDIALGFGTGRAATPADANRVIGLTVRGAIAETFGESTAQAVRVQYGGSVNPVNCVPLRWRYGGDRVIASWGEWVYSINVIDRNFA